MPSPAGSSTATMWQVLFEAAGILDDIEWTYGSWRESYDALRGDAVDCIPSLLHNGREAPIQSELTTTVGVRILPIPDDAMMQAKALNLQTYISLVPGGNLPRIDHETGADESRGTVASGP